MPCSRRSRPMTVQRSSRRACNLRTGRVANDYAGRNDSDVLGYRRRGARSGSLKEIVKVWGKARQLKSTGPVAHMIRGMPRTLGSSSTFKPLRQTLLARPRPHSRHRWRRETRVFFGKQRSRERRGKGPDLKAGQTNVGSGPGEIQTRTEQEDRRRCRSGGR